MENNKKIISASEINKYTYCPYQWYYERFYGAKYIREKYKQRNEKYKMKDAFSSNLNRGLRFHKNYMIIEKNKYIFKTIILMLIIVAIIYLFFTQKGF